MLVASIPHTDFTGAFRLIGTGTLTLPGEVPPLSWELTIRPLAPSVLGLRPKPPPSRREVLRRAAAVNAHGGFLQFVTSLTRPVSVVHPKAPLSKGRRAAAVNAHGGFLQFVTSLTRPVSAVHPKAPLSKGRRAAAVNAHGGFLQFVTTLTRPVSAVHPKAPLSKGAGTPEA